MLDNFLQKSYNIFTVRQGETSERKISERNLKKGLTNLRDSDIILKLSREGDWVERANSILKIEQCEEKSNDPWDSFAEFKNLVKKVKKRLKNTFKNE